MVSLFIKLRPVDRRKPSEIGQNTKEKAKMPAIIHTVKQAPFQMQSVLRLDELEFNALVKGTMETTKLQQLLVDLHVAKAKAEGSERTNKVGLIIARIDRYVAITDERLQALSN
jgi:hypothetical protein